LKHPISIGIVDIAYLNDETLAVGDMRFIAKPHRVVGG
jgi:hypothetical protein